MRAHLFCVTGTSDESTDPVAALLSHQVGMSRSDRRPITVRKAIEASDRDPAVTARRLITLPPEAALEDLTGILSGFRIDEVACPDPQKYARQALRRAGVDLAPFSFNSDYGHSATALLGIAALGLLLAFPNLLF